MLEVTIEWLDVDSIPELGQGHGVELYYAPTGELANAPVVAFVDGYAWLHGTSDRAEVRILKPDSAEFATRGIDGPSVTALARKVLLRYIPRRKLVPHGHTFGKCLKSHLNA